MSSPDGKPLRVRLFGANYVAFRSSDGHVGFFDEACPHRGASLALARNEDNALRCIYHGWKFRVDGVTVAVPTQPHNEAEYCKHVPLKHYPVRESAGIVWVWLGQGAEPPPLPKLPFIDLPAENMVVFRQKVPANWLQGVETTMDSAHLGVLHQSGLVGFGDIEFSSVNMAPVYHVAYKPFGFRYAAVRALKDERAYGSHAEIGMRSTMPRTRICRVRDPAGVSAPATAPQVPAKRCGITRRDPGR